jgi:hypothetical protein
MLHVGRLEIEGAKKTAEQVIDDAKAIKGVFQWFIGLFTTKPTADAPKPVAKKTPKRASVPSTDPQSYNELEAKLLHDIGLQLGTLFDVQQQITNHYIELEEESKNKFNPEQNTSKKAVERVLIELQLEQLMQDVREVMVYAPPQTKNLYSRFLVMHGKIEREQEWARSEMVRRARLARWRKEQEEIRVIETISGVIAVAFISLIFGWLMWQLQSWSTGY